LHRFLKKNSAGKRWNYINSSVRPLVLKDVNVNTTSAGIELFPALVSHNSAGSGKVFHGVKKSAGSAGISSIPALKYLNLLQSLQCGSAGKPALLFHVFKLLKSLHNSAGIFLPLKGGIKLFQRFFIPPVFSGAARKGKNNVEN